MSQWIDQEENYPQLLEYLSLARYIGAPQAFIENAFKGEACNPSCSTCRKIPNFSLPFKYQANFPLQSHVVWIIEQMKRWGELAADVDSQGLAGLLYLTDLYREVVSGLGVRLLLENIKQEGLHKDPWLLDGVELGVNALI